MKLYILHWIGNVIAFALTALFLPGIWFERHWAVLVGAVALGLLNAIVRPVLLFLTLPLNIISLGLFTIALNGAIFFSLGYIVPPVMIRGYGWAVAGSLVYSAFTTLFSWLLHERQAVNSEFRLWKL